MKYKFLRKKGKYIVSNSGKQTWKIGEWVKCEGDLNICNNGLHCSKTIYQAFSYVPGEVVARVECRGKKIIEDDKECWEEMRIVEAKKWDKKASVSLAIFSAELVLKNFEKEYPNDLRPREAIEAAKKVLFHDTAKNRAAAWSARSAARSARSAARSARSAAESAAWSAAWSARSARSARSAWSAAWSARSAAESAAWSAAWSARSAAESAAWSAAWSARSARSAAIKKIQKYMEKQYKDLEEIK